MYFYCFLFVLFRRDIWLSGNPIGIKCGPTLKADDLINLCNRINPSNEKGKITLISRFGANKVENYLPKLIREIKKLDIYFKFQNEKKKSGITMNNK